MCVMNLAIFVVLKTFFLVLVLFLSSNNIYLISIIVFVDKMSNHWLNHWCLCATEMMQSLAQRPAPANTNRERRPRYQHPKGAPNADLIFKTGGRWDVSPVCWRVNTEMMCWIRAQYLIMYWPRLIGISLNREKRTRNERHEKRDRQERQDRKDKQERNQRYVTDLARTAGAALDKHWGLECNIITIRRSFSKSVKKQKRFHWRVLVYINKTISFPVQVFFLKLWKNF